MGLTGNYSALITQGTRDNLFTILNGSKLIMFKCTIMHSNGLLRICLMSLLSLPAKEQRAGVYIFK